ncbi:MAG: hypothetical protein P8Y70_00100 [Candidatus Lokiarchaeota archaeon]
MNFTTKKIDLILTVTIGDKEETLIPKVNVTNSAESVQIAAKWKLLEETRPDNDTGLDIIAAELETIYSKSKEWFLNNIDPITLREIATYVARQLAGIQKK